MLNHWRMPLLNILLLVLLVSLTACFQPKSNLPKHLRSLEPQSSKDFSNKAHNMFIKQFYVPQSQSNIYLIGCKSTKEAALIDYGGYGSTEVGKYLRGNGLTLKAVFLTHGHNDHIWGSSLIQNLYNVPVYIHEDDKYGYQKMESIYQRAGITHKATPANLVSVKEGDQINIGDFQVNVMHTPGHSQGSVCYYIPLKSVLFSGDTLFKNAVGRYTFAGGSKDDLKKSVIRLLALPEYTNVFAGHMDTTTINQEKPNNMVYSF